MVAGYGMTDLTQDMITLRQVTQSYLSVRGALLLEFGRTGVVMTLCHMPAKNLHVNNFNTRIFLILPGDGDFIKSVYTLCIIRHTWQGLVLGTKLYYYKMIGLLPIYGIFRGRNSPFDTNLT